MNRQVLLALVGLGTLGGCTLSELAPGPGKQEPIAPPVGGDPNMLSGVAGAAGGGCGGMGGSTMPVPPGVRKPPGFQPMFGTPVKAAVSPLPISGGTLAVLSNNLAVAADPERDHLYVVDIANQKVSKDIALTAGDQPGRVVEGAAGIAHVILRAGGAVVTVDTATGTIKSRRAVCAAPRGIAYDPTGAAVASQTGPLLHVACAGGELVSLPAADDKAAPVRTLALDLDLRDIVAAGPSLLVSRFKDAEILTIDSGGKVAKRVHPGVRMRKGFSGLESMTPAVAWRMVPVTINASLVSAPGADAPKMGAVVVHQRAQAETVVAGPGGYSGDISCGSIVESAVSVVTPGESPSPTGGPALAANVLPVDIAVAPGSGRVAVVAAGNVNSPLMASVTVFDSVDNVTSSPNNGSDCVTPPGSTMPGFGGSVVGSTSVQPHVVGQTVAVAYAKDGTLIGQSREPAQLWIFDGTNTKALPTVTLATDTRVDTGHSIFHSNSGGDIACASCHPEGGDDGRTWKFACVGDRRTQSLRGGITGTEPFHWDGDQTTFPHLVDDVFVGRMSGPTLQNTQTDALLHWVDSIPTLPLLTTLTAPGAAARGKALFESAAVGCGTCHNGTRLTNNMTVDVGTGKALQVPSLNGVGWRAPFMHDGCAPTLADRFGTCGGGDKHGHTSQLSKDQISDLVAYLESI